MLPRLVLGFGHRRRRGKDLSCRLAAELLAGLDVPCRVDHFARSLKEGVKAIFGLTEDQVNGDAKFTPDPFWQDTPRRILQLVGTECMRNGYDKQIWARTLERRALADPKTSVVIGDVRFPNEVAAIHRLGGFVVRVDRDVPARPEEDNHLSETALADYDGWDHVITNDGDVKDLWRKVRDVIGLCRPEYWRALEAQAR